MRSQVHWHSGKNKTTVLGIPERGVKIVSKVINNNRNDAPEGSSRTCAGWLSAFYGCLTSYGGPEEFQHEVIDHAIAYVEGEVHANGLEDS